MFLGVDGGGTKTAFALIDACGKLVASSVSGGSYYPEIGLEKAAQVIGDGIAALMRTAGIRAENIQYAFLGLPAYGEDRQLTPLLDRLPQAALANTQFRCGNDMVCSWAGSLACRDGISVIAGTGSIAYGQFAGREYRAGGWGELFSDEGSAYWIAREGLAAFSRMSDGRLARSALYETVRAQLQLTDDIDVCALLYGNGNSRRYFAQMAQVVSDAAELGDSTARDILQRAGEELAAIVQAVHRGLQVAATIPISYSGGVFHRNRAVLAAFTDAAQRTIACQVQPPILPPVIGAAMYAGKLHGVQWAEEAVAQLAVQCHQQDRELPQ